MSRRDTNGFIQIAIVASVITFLMVVAPESLHAQLPNITTTTLPSGTVGTSYSQTLAATGGTTPYTWSIITGSLPGGLMRSGGTISGTPTTAGTFNFTVQVTDSSIIPLSDTQALTLVIVAPLNITTTTLPNATALTSYSQVLAATGGTLPLAWSVPPGTLPAGLNLSAGGTISGTPTTPGTSNFTVTVTDATSPTKSDTQALTIIVAPAPLNITTTTLPNATALTSYSQVLAATGGTLPFAWSVPPGTLPAGLNLSAGGTISGTPTTPGTSNFTVTVTDASSPTKSDTQALTIIVAPAALNITTTTLPNATATSPYSQVLAATGGTLPYAWSVPPGTLPAGLNLSAGGTISGTPTAAGTSNFTVTATDNSSPIKSDTQALTIIVAPAPAALNITTTGLPNATVGTAYSLALAATGGTLPYNWSMFSNALPPGLALSPGGIISGTPAIAGTTNFSVGVTDASNPQKSDDQALTLIVSPATLTITTGSLPDALTATSYSQGLTAIGGTLPYAWTVSAGALPAGLTLSAAGTISGTPTTAGPSNFTVQVSDAANPVQTASRALSMVVNSSGIIITPLTITTPSPLTAAVIGNPYSQQLAASTAALSTWSIASGSLPSGLSLSSTGVISGTPSALGIFDFVVQVSDSGQTATKPIRLVVNPTLAITTAAALPPGTLSASYSATLAASGGVPPYSWSLTSGSLPAGLTLSSSGQISGTPTTTGTFTATVQVRDAATPQQSANQVFTITIGSQALMISPPTVPNAIQNVPYSQQIAASGGVLPYAWSVISGSLPAGVTLSAGGLLSGIPTVQGVSTFTVRVTDAQSNSTSQAFTLTVGPPVGSLAVIGLPATANPAQQLPFGMALSSPYPSPLSGQLTISFVPNAVVPIDDPAVQFSTGSRTITFTIPANTTTAIFPSQVLLLTGTVAGSVNLTANILSGPSNLAIGSIGLPAVSPRMNSVVSTRTATGLNVQIIGYSPERRVTSANFVFSFKAAGTQPVTLTRNVEADFANWYQSSGSVPFGSTFVFVQSFTIQGDINQIDSVTVTLTNGQGSNSFVPVKMPGN